MSTVTTFSTQFPAGHSKAGKPTFFIEKIWMSVYGRRLSFSELSELNPTWKELDLQSYYANMLRIEQRDGPMILPKQHTIREKKKCKPGDVFSFRVWSARPYASKQIIIVQDTKIVRVADIEIDKDFIVRIDGKFENRIGSLSANDGLIELDFRQWLKAPFSGQIRIWDDTDLPY